MKHVILGTAGHVDHGKTLLIKALTGIDTDRLAEEKKRGITIELGFAHLDFEGGTRLGIVDVPGHERFIHHMLAGAGGMDLGMLVIAANEGIMPQTVEHLGILRLLGLRDGLVVITKTDLVDSEWLELVKADIRDLVKGSFLDGKPILPVSAVSGEGLDKLKQTLHDMTLAAENRNPRLPFRLPIDRVFHAEGFGTVITGTLIEGSVAQGDTVELFPSCVTAKVRGLQVHGESVDRAEAGQRVAVNLSGIRKENVARGDVAAAPGTLRTSSMLDVRLTVLQDSRRTIRSNTVLHLHLNTRELLARAVLLDRTELAAGESTYAQLRLQETVAVKPGDRFVVRFYSPLETIGGGVILDERPSRHKPGNKDVLAALALREDGSLSQKITQTVMEQEYTLPDVNQLEHLLHIPAAELNPILASLVSAGHLSEPLPGRYVTPYVLDKLRERCLVLLENYHRDNPLSAGILVPELRQKLLPDADLPASTAILHTFEREQRISLVSGCICLYGFHVELTARQMDIRNRLLENYRNAGLGSPSADGTAANFAPEEQEDVRQIISKLIKDGLLVSISPEWIISREEYDRIWMLTRKHFETSPELSLSGFRDMLSISRKNALAILDYFDRNNLTRRVGDVRYLRKNARETR